MTKEENNKIEYVLWDGMRVSEVTPWISEALNKKFDEIGAIMRYSDRIEITTPSGTLTAMKGDYIIKIENGELYPCNPILFASLNNNVHIRLSEQQSNHEQEMKEFLDWTYKNGWRHSVTPNFFIRVEYPDIVEERVPFTELLTKFKNR